MKYNIQEIKYVMYIFRFEQASENRGSIKSQFAQEMYNV